MNNPKKNFDSVVKHIEQNLDSPLNIENLCQIAHLSKFHFHRQFSARFGITIMSLVKQLRLKRAAFKLAYRKHEKIIDIALSTGYESHEAFSRAFKKVFLVSPSSFRTNPDWTPWHTQYEKIISLRTQLMLNKYQVDTIHFPETRLAVLEHKGSPQSLGTSISKFIDWRKKHKLPPHKSRTFNLLYNDPTETPEELFRFGLGCEVNFELPNQHSEVIAKSIPACLCAKVRHIGSDDTIGTAINYLYRTWLMENKYDLRDFPLFFERVSFFPDVSEHNAVTDIYLPILP